jgi:hypothetical protein
MQNALCLCLLVYLEQHETLCDFSRVHCEQLRILLRHANNALLCTQKQASQQVQPLWILCTAKPPEGQEAVIGAAIAAVLY